MSDSYASSSQGHDILAEGDAITCDRYMLGVQDTRGATYTKRDFLFRGGSWRSVEVSPTWRLPSDERRVLVVGHSDYHLTEPSSRLMQLLGTRRIFAVNANPVPSLVIPLPLGLTNHTNESKAHQVFGDQSHFDRAYSLMPQRPAFNASIYVNMTIRNAARARLEALTAVADLPGAEVCTPQLDTSGRIAYLSALRRSNFVLSPQGNGVDTTRTWESLYMGGIPIVLRHRCLEGLLSELPVVQVHSWKQLRDPSFLESEWDRIVSQTWDLTMLRVSYWLEKFRIAASDYVS